MLALGTNADRERDLLPVRFDISFGMVGMRLLLMRQPVQGRRCDRLRDALRDASKHPFDAFPRGLDEAPRELRRFHDTFPVPVIESTKALYFSYPIYFWVNRHRSDLAQRIDLDLKAALADGSPRQLFERFHANDVRLLTESAREVILLRSNASLPGHVEPDTSW